VCCCVRAGSWKTFTGDEIGALLAHWQWSRWRAAHPEEDASGVYMLASTVSSKMLGAMAAAEGFRYATRTGTLLGGRGLRLSAQPPIKPTLRGCAAAQLPSPETRSAEPGRSPWGAVWVRVRVEIGDRKHVES
jgi:hypothetical protein